MKPEMTTLWNGLRGWITPRANPIGVDFGTARLRLAQTATVDGVDRLVAAAAADVPPEARNDPAAREAFFVATVKRLLASADFRGRAAVLALPAADTHFLHLRLAKMTDAELKAALPFEAAARLPVPADKSVLRHLIAGDVGEGKQEVIVMAAARARVERLLAAAARAKLDVVGMETEVKTLVGGFGRLYRRRIDREQALCFVDVGAEATRVMIARGGHVLFARAVPVGMGHVERAICGALKIDATAARRLLCPHAEPVRELIRPERDGGGSVPRVGVLADPCPTAPPEHGSASTPTRGTDSFDQACVASLAKLADELTLCRRYHEATFPDRPVERLVFLGGGAHATAVCRDIARRLGVAASVGDPLLRLASNFQPPEDCPLDPGRPGPDWFVAVGLGLTAAPAIVQPADAKAA